ncbi:MAG: hypothetical protein AUJ52_06300 [Elusimicrobia bacterium CG1_02_63_36]|nr:MAG: hypothetical protein AUJ52_06300 [Elusimicrobia bacterium CG1_02_63_36]
MAPLDAAILAVLLGATPASANPDFYAGTPRRATPAQYAAIEGKIKTAIEHLEKAEKKEMEALAVGPTVESNCGEPGLFRWAKERWYDKCRGAIAKRSTHKKLARIEEAKAEAEFDSAIEITISAYDLRPTRMGASSFYDGSPFHKWSPKIEFDMVTDQATMKRRRIHLQELNLQHDYGRTRDGDIRIRLLSFMNPPGNIKSDRISGGPDRLALTILHESIHWAEQADDHEHGAPAGARRTPHARRMLEYRANRAEEDFARALMKDSFPGDPRPKISQAQVDFFKTRADNYLKSARDIEKHYPNSQHEADLPKRLQRREFLDDGGYESGSIFPSAMETLKEAGETEFLDAWQRDTKRILEEIERSRREAEERKRREEQRRQALDSPAKRAPPRRSRDCSSGSSLGGSMSGSLPMPCLPDGLFDAAPVAPAPVPRAPVSPSPAVRAAPAPSPARYPYGDYWLKEIVGMFAELCAEPERSLRASNALEALRLFARDESRLKEDLRRRAGATNRPDCVRSLIERLPEYRNSARAALDVESLRRAAREYRNALPPVYGPPNGGSGPAPSRPEVPTCRYQDWCREW